MKQKVKITLEVEATFGSDFQRECAMEAFHAMILVWETHYANSHKGNKIESAKTIEEIER